MSTYDLFVSYAEADRWWVEGYLLDALAAANLRVQRETTFQLGAPRLAEFARAVAESERTLLILSPAFAADGSAQFVALLAQHFGADTRTWPVIPLTLHEVDRPDPALAMLVGLDARSPPDWDAVVRRLCAELQKPLPRAAQPPPCPYPGMRAFRVDEGSTFFGRDAEVRALIERHLRLHPFVAVIGASGSGKSSLVFAGLVPALRKSPFFGAGDWDVRALRPGADPQKALQEAVANPSTTALRLLIVDQFEEIFTLARAQGDAGRAAFCDALLALAGSGWHVVLTARADFYGDLMRLPKLWPEVREHRFELTPLGRDALREAIVGPAERIGVLVEPALVERLLADAGSEPGILPFLQETLLLLWAGLERRSLPALAYDRLVADAERAGHGGLPSRSGLGVAMATRADQALAVLPSDAARDIARRVLLRLVQFGEGRADTRRQQRRGQLRSGDEDPALFDDTVRHLIATRLLIASGGEAGADADDTLLDIAHEALLSGWPQLADWISKRREGEQARRWLREQADRWLERVQAGQGGGLLDEVETAEAERWRERYGGLVGRDAAVEQLLEASRREVDRERDAAERRRRQELEQQTRLAAEQSARADDAVRFAREQVELNDALAALNAQLRQSAAANAFVQATALLESDSADRAIARLVQTLRLTPAHGPSRCLLYGLLTRLWHLRPTGDAKCDEGIRYIQSTPDGRFRVCGGARHTWIHDRNGERDVAVLQHPSDLQSIALDPTGRLLLTASTTFGSIHGPIATGTVAIWRVDGGELLHTVDVRGMVTKAIFGAGGERVYVSSAFGPSAFTAALQPAPDRWPADINRSLYKTDNVLCGLHVHAGTGRIAWLGMPHMIGEGELYVWDHWGKGPVQRSDQPGVSAFVFGPDGKTAAVAGPLVPSGMRGLGMQPNGFSGVIDLADNASFAAQPLSHDGPVNVLVANNSWTRLVSASSDHRAILWRPEGTVRVAELAHNAAPTAAAFSPGGWLLATGTAAGAVRIWHGFGGEALSEIAWHEAEVSSLIFDPTGRELIVGLASGRVVTYDTASTVARNAVIETGKPRMKDARFAAEGGTCLLVRSEDRIETWDAMTLQPRSELLPDDDKARIADNDPERALVIDGTHVRVLMLADGRQSATVALPDEAMFASFGSGGRRVIAASRKTLRIIQVGDGAGGFTFDLADGEDSAIVAVRELAEDRLLIADHNRLRIVRMADGTTLDERAGDATQRIRMLEESGFVTREEQMSIVGVEVDEELARVLVLYGHPGASVLQPRYNEHYVVEDAQIWSLSPLAPLAPSFGSAPEGHEVNGATAAWAAGRVVTTSNDGDVDLWDLSTGRRAGGPYRQPEPVHHASLSPDAKHVAVYGKSRQAAVFDLVSGESVGRPLLHAARIENVRFVMPAVVVTWDEHGGVRLWDALTGLQLGPEVVFGGGVISGTAGSAGDLVVTVGHPGVANIARIGDAALFDSALTSLLDFAESLCGWTVTPLGIEARMSSSAPADDMPPAMQAFRDWFDDVSSTRACFAGCPASLREQVLGFAAAAPAYIGMMIVEILPAHPLGWLRLAEGAASGDPQQFGVVAQRLRLASLDEMNAIARAWCTHAAQLAGDAPDYMKRIAAAETALGRPHRPPKPRSRR